MRRTFGTLWSRVREPGSTAGMLFMAIVVGAAVGLATVVMVELLAVVEHGAGELAEWLPGDWIWMFVTVPIGLWAAWALTQRLAPEAAGDGVPEVTAALVVSAGTVRTRVAPVKTVATALTLGLGGSAGREGPIAHIGASLGSGIARRARLGEDQVRSLLAAGAGAGIGASFNAPIAGMLFAMEVVLGGFSVRHLNTVVVSSVTAAVVSRSIAGAELGFPIVKYELQDARELLLYAAIGLLAVVAGYLMLRSMALFEKLGERIGQRSFGIVPIVFGLGIAGLGLVSAVVADEGSALAPPVLGTGQEFVGSLLSGASMTWWILVALLLLKIFATSATLGVRASGGAFAPSLFVGAVLGAGFYALVEPVWGLSDLRSGAFALVGMSAVFAAVARAPLTSILIVFEITQDYNLVLPLMLATTLATLLTERVHPLSAYTMALRRMGIRETRRGDVDLLDTVAVGDVLSPVPAHIAPGDTLGEVQGQLDRHRHHGLPVVDGDRLVGIVTVTDVMRAGGPSDQVTAADAMTPHPQTVTPNTLVSTALERMAVLGVGRLPVVASADRHQVVGMFRREDAVRAYHLALGAGTQHELAGASLRERVSPGTGFSTFEVPAGSIAAGRTIREVAWPDGATLVSVRRGRRVMVPDGSTRLESGDIVTSFGTPAAHDLLERRLSEPDPAGHPTGEHSA